MSMFICRRMVLRSVHQVQFNSETCTHVQLLQAMTPYQLKERGRQYLDASKAHGAADRRNRRAASSKDDSATHSALDSETSGVLWTGLCIPSSMHGAPVDARSMNFCYASACARWPSCCLLVFTALHALPCLQVWSWPSNVTGVQRAFDVLGMTSPL